MTEQKYIDSFWKKVDKHSNSNGCWEWIGSSKHRFGYGRYSGKLSHRISYEIEYGPLTSKECILHQCDNPKCVNPEHLKIGSRKENAKERDLRNRTAHGETISNSLFTNAEVLKIRNSNKSITELAIEYNTSYQTMWAIIKKINYSHI